MRNLPGAVTLCVVFAALLGAGPGGPRPREMGYTLPWNRVNEDSVVDLAPGERWPRVELSGRLVDKSFRPLSTRLYVYYADLKYGYGSPASNDIPYRAGTLTTGPGGGYLIRCDMPSAYEGAPHLHIEMDGEGGQRLGTFVALYPDSSAWPFPGGNSPSVHDRVYEPHRSLVHLDADGVYRATHALRLVDLWTPLPLVDSVRAALAEKYERRPWHKAARARSR